MVDEDGDYELSITATDECGRITTDDRNFIIDTVDPEISITGIENGEVYVVNIAGEFAATDENLASSSATLDGTPIDPSFMVTTVGLHNLEVTAEDCAANTAERSIGFQTVLPVEGLTGTVAAEPAEVEPPLPLQATAGIANTIDTPYSDLVLSLEIVDSLTGLSVDSFETTVDLPAGADFDLEHAFATDGLDLGEYELSFSVAGTVYGAVFESEIASQIFEVVDRTAPMVSLLSPNPGLVCDPIEVRVTATDTASGVNSVRAHIDGDPVGLPLEEIGGDLWAVDLSLDEGVHNLDVVAEDVAGNRSDSATVEIDLDLTRPVLTVEAPEDGACLVGPTTISFTAEDLHLDVVRARLDGVTINPGAVVSADGDHHLYVSAVDACGHMDTHVSDFTIDGAPPVITVTGVSDGGEYSSPVEISWAIDDANLADHSSALDGQPVESGAVVDTPGSHILVIEAADCADNHERVEIGFTITGGSVLRSRDRAAHPHRRRQHPPSRSFTGGRRGARNLAARPRRAGCPGDRRLCLHR